MKRTFFFPIKNRMEGMSTIPFDHVEPGAAVRVVSLGGVQYLSVFDLIMCVCEKSASNAARTWRHLSPEQRSQVMAECVAHTFPEQPEQPVITFQGAMRLVPLLPGDGPRKHRFAVASVLRKYHVGEASLVEAPPSVSTTRVQRDMDKLKGAVELLVSAAEERAAFEQLFTKLGAWAPFTDSVPAALGGTPDISSFGGWRAWLAAQETPP